MSEITKATVCSKDNCVTVYGDTARLINIIAIVAVVFILGAWVHKALS